MANGRCEKHWGFAIFHLTFAIQAIQPEWCPSGFRCSAHGNMAFVRSERRMRRRNRYVLLALVPALCLGAAANGIRAQGSSDTARSVSDSGITVVAEVFCSQIKLRTPSVRLRWGVTAAARATNNLTSLAAVKQTVDTTVYAGGFEKGLYVSLPVPAGPVQTPVAAAAAPNAPARQTPVRAFQIRLVEAGPPPAATAGTAVPRESADANDFSVVIEDLEAGVNYTWRITIDAGAARMVSTPVTTQAPTCPADM